LKTNFFRDFKRGSVACKIFELNFDGRDRYLSFFGDSNTVHIFSLENREKGILGKLFDAVAGGKSAYKISKNDFIKGSVTFYDRDKIQVIDYDGAIECYEIEEGCDEWLRNRRRDKLFSFK
jgi:hypothetical protein